MMWVGWFCVHWSGLTNWEWTARAEVSTQDNSIQSCHLVRYTERTHTHTKSTPARLLTIHGSGQYPLQWSPQEMCPQIPSCFQKDSVPVHKACCQTQTSSQTLLSPFAKLPCPGLMVWSNYPHCGDKKIKIKNGRNKINHRITIVLSRA